MNVPNRTMEYRVRIKENEREISTQTMPIFFKKLLNMRVTLIPIVSGTLGTVPKGLDQGLKELEIRERIETVLAKIGQNTEKSPGDLRRLIVTQTSEKKPSANADLRNSSEVR